MKKTERIIKMYHDYYSKPPVKCFVCDRCGEDVLEGDSYIDVNNNKICEFCIEDMTTKEVVELFGFQFEEAEKEEEEREYE